MLIFLYGPDDYRREEKRRGIKDEFLKKYSNLSVGSFDLSEKDAFDEFKTFIKSQSIFETKKIAFIENAFEVEGEKDNLILELTSFLENKNTTVVISEKNKPLKAFSFLLEKPVLVQEFKNLEGKEWEQFILKTSKQQGIEFDITALGFLARNYTGNSWGVITEIEKLSSLGKTRIELKDVEGTMLEALPDFWSVMNGLKSHEIGERLFILEKLFAVHEPAAKIFNILSSMSKDRATDFADYDLKVKSGKLEYEEALVDAVLG